MGKRRRSPDSAHVVSLPEPESHTKTQTAGQNDGKPKKERPETPENCVLALQVSASGQYVAVCDDRKYLHVYRTFQGSWERLNSRCVSRRCTTVHFTKDDAQVLVADKSGDVFAFPVLEGQCEGHPEAKVKDDPPEAAEAEEEEEAVKAGELKLGHLSMLLDMVLVEDDSLIVTCDRDEKIRISHYPHAFDISAFCLGHTAFVISLAFDRTKKLLMSGSGDCTIRLWSLEGTQLSCTNVITDAIDSMEHNHTENGTEPGSKPPTSESVERPAIQQIVYCEKCCLLVVAMYRSPQILLYRLLSEASQQPSLQFVCSLVCSHTVTSMCLHNCVLWVATADVTTHQTHMAAYTLKEDDTSSEINVSSISDEDSSPQGKALHTLNQELGQMKGPVVASDSIFHLWKSSTDGYLNKYRERKRQRLEGGHQKQGDRSKGDGCRWGKHARGKPALR